MMKDCEYFDSRSVHPENGMYCTGYDVIACENYYPRKWQAMHDANACENYISIILQRQYKIALIMASSHGNTSRITGHPWVL